MIYVIIDFLDSDFLYSLSNVQFESLIESFWCISESFLFHQALELWEHELNWVVFGWTNWGVNVFNSLIIKVVSYLLASMDAKMIHINNEFAILICINYFLKKFLKLVSINALCKRLIKSKSLIDTDRTNKCESFGIKYLLLYLNVLILDHKFIVFPSRPCEHSLVNVIDLFTFVHKWCNLLFGESYHALNPVSLSWISRLLYDYLFPLYDILSIQLA